MPMLNKLKKNKIELIILLFVLIVAGGTHSYNMFHFPYYENDEGTYMAQAWSVLTQGKLAPYTYWYDHAPLGWFLIAFWTLISGGFFTFGLSVNSGRVFMLIIHLISTLFVYLITKKLTKNTLASALASLIFSLTPLGIYYQRRVLLDNIMIFWILFSFYLLIGTGRKLRHFFASALTFGIAVLTKESAIYFFPVFIYIVYSQAHKIHRSFAVIKWIAISTTIISIYILYAIIKGELFPSGTPLGGNNPHVSLIETLTYQMSRSGEGNFLNPNGAFQWNLKTNWLAKDPLIIIVGVFATFFSLIIGIRKNTLRYVAFLTASYWIYLMRGGIVIEFYIIPLIPLLAIIIAMSVSEVSNPLSKLPLGKIVSTLPFFVIVSLLIFFYKDKTEIYTKDQTSQQVQAIQWIKNNVPKDSIILIDNYAFVDLRSRIPNSIYVQKDAQYYWRADKDPEIKINLLKNDWRNIDYILFSDHMKYDIYNADLDLVREAYENSTSLKKYTGVGYDIEIRKVNDDRDILSKAWKTYKQTFTRSAGAIYDPYNSRITSEGQAYSLLRSVWTSDKREFDKVWKWTDENMKLEDKNLFAWLYEEKEINGEEGIRDKGTATDADQDIALALLFAYKKWENLDYLNQAKRIINDIWKYETVEIKGKRYVVAGNWASVKENKIYTINPSYIAPYAYRIFAKVDTQHDWHGLINTSYEIIQRCSESVFGFNGSANIPPDWCALDKNGKIVIANNISGKSTNYSYDAIRTLWRVALDYRWNKEPRALSFLKKMDIWQREWEEKQKIFISYSRDGKAVESAESLAHYGTQLALFSIIDPYVADQIYKQKVLSQWNKDGYWGDKNNFYDQNWVWFGIALYKNNLPNLWTYNTN